MEFTLLPMQGNLVVRIFGELDQHYAEEVRKAVDKEWKREIYHNLIFSLENLEFMDSSGIGLFMGRYKTVSEKGGRVAICGPPPSIKRVIELSGLLKLMDIYRDEEEALNKLVLN